MESGGGNPTVMGIVISTVLCIGSVVVERNAGDLPAICGSTAGSDPNVVNLSPEC